MKKLIILFLLLTLSTPAFAKIEPPKWEEFCPPEYVNAEYDNYKSKIPLWAGIPLCISIIGLPFVAADGSNIQKAELNNYWVKRREDFQNSLVECKNIKNENELIYKYLSIRQAEQAKNQQRQNEILQAQQLQTQRMQAYQYTQNRQIQNNINNFTNQYQNDKIMNNIKYGF